MIETKTDRIASFDGVELAVHRMGENDGRPLILLHGLFSNAETNWIKFGHAAKLAEAGFHVIMPDLRAHGQSAAPHDAAAYPHDVLIEDALHLIDHFALDDFDLGGFSLGSRTSAKLLANGLRPRRAILSGMGWEGLTGWGRRRDFFVTAIDNRETVKRGDPHFFAVSFMKTQGIDPVAARLLLDSFGDVDTARLVEVDTPILVLCGKDDADNGSAPELARRLADGRYAEIPGTHMSSVVETALGDEMVSVLTA